MLYRLVSWNSLLSSTRREGKRAPAFLPASLLGYRATSISGSSVNPPFARLDVYVSYDFSTIARLRRFFRAKDSFLLFASIFHKSYTRNESSTSDLRRYYV